MFESFILVTGESNKNCKELVVRNADKNRHNVAWWYLAFV